jgi:hypothetical protein
MILLAGAFVARDLFPVINLHMKPARSVLAFLLMVLTCNPSAHAQLKGFSFGPYLEAAWPKGSLARTNGRGIGLGLSADVKLGSNISAMGSYGYLHFGRRSSSDNPGAAINAWPLRAGLKYKLPLFYFKMESGTAKLDKAGSSDLILSPGAGIRLLGLDLQGSYEAWLGKTGCRFISMKLAYHF